VFFTDIYQFIAPIFNAFTPLPDGPLKTEIQKLAVDLNFPLSQVLILEDNKSNPQNAHSNALVYLLIVMNAEYSYRFFCLASWWAFDFPRR